MAKRVVMSWSGGKDSSLALLQLLRDPSVEVVGLLTTVTETELLALQYPFKGPILKSQRGSLLPKPAWVRETSR